MSEAKAHLTRRETQTLDHLIEGMTTDEIALAMSIGYRTVKFHLANAQAKLDARNRWHVAAIWAGAKAAKAVAELVLRGNVAPQQSAA